MSGRNWLAIYLKGMVCREKTPTLEPRHDRGSLIMAETSEPYLRDLVGYGRKAPHPRWPNDARLALEFAVNLETGGERCVLHGDTASESAFTDLWDPPPVVRGRNLMCESVFEYGPRVGIWRLLRILSERNIKGTLLAVGMAITRVPEVGRAFAEAGFEIAAHGWRWLDYQDVPVAIEREHIRLNVEAIHKVTGNRPVGWLTGRPGPNTRRLHLEQGGFIYDRDALNDELPYWVTVSGRPHLILPYYLDTNDNGYESRRGFATGDAFFTYLREAFDFFYKEGATSPRMMTVPLHDRLAGRPARAAGLEKFLDYVGKFPDVWVCRGVDIANHWRSRFPYAA